jgi:hypothetical protein
MASPVKGRRISRRDAACRGSGDGGNPFISANLGIASELPVNRTESELATNSTVEGEVVALSEPKGGRRSV